MKPPISISANPIPKIQIRPTPVSNGIPIPIPVIEPPTGLEILQNAESEILAKMARFPEQIVELNSQYIRAKQRTEIYLKGIGQKIAEQPIYLESGIAGYAQLLELLPPEAFICMDESTLDACGIFKICENMYTNSLCVFQDNISAIYERAMKAKGVERVGLIDRYRTLAKRYNTIVKDNIWELNAIS